MNNLQQIIVIAACLAIPVSIWAIVYFVARIAVQWQIRHDLGDMPSADEIHKMYEQNNKIIRGQWDEEPLPRSRNLFDE
jgi:hypothetical protein